MIGPLEIVIILVVLLVLFGGYKKLPELGRRAGSGARVGGEKAKELADKVGEKGREKAGDRIDPASMGRSAGKHVRDAREFRDSFKGSLDASLGSDEKRTAEPEPGAGPEPIAAPEGSAVQGPEPNPNVEQKPPATDEPEPPPKPESSTS